jgi:trans-aconitate methyltransferase
MKLINYLGSPTEFEQLYNQIRKDEGRLLSLEQIEKLPYTEQDFQHHKEWNKRIRSTDRFLKYVKKHKVRSLLDIGCGNGWLMNKLAPHLEKVDGIDINLMELEQARALLKAFDNVTLYYADIFSLSPDNKYELILLNASFQYFEQLPLLMDRLGQLLAPNGEIHVLDSPLYSSQNQASKAQQRSLAYYSSKNTTEMARFYHHHTLADLADYQVEIRHNPNAILQKIKRKVIEDSPLWWFVVRLK